MVRQALDKLQKKALEQFKSGESLFGKVGAIAPIFKSFIEAALQPDAFNLTPPQDCHSSFEPELVKILQLPCQSPTGSISLSYTFGSDFANIVNTRF